MFKEYGGDHEQVMNVFLTVYLFVDVLTVYLFVDVQGVWR